MLLVYPLVPGVLTVVILPAIAASRVAFLPDVAGVAVAGVPAIAGVLVVPSVPADPGVPIYLVFLHTVL